MFIFFFFFNDTATTEIYTLSLHDALPISSAQTRPPWRCTMRCTVASPTPVPSNSRSEEHTSELQSLAYLVCRLLLEKKKNVSYAASVISHRDQRDLEHSSLHTCGGLDDSA